MSVWRQVRWSIYAPVYDGVRRPTADARRRSLVLLDLTPGERVLILGCGTGLDFALIPSGVRAEAVDVSPAMVRRARRRADRLGSGIGVRVMDAARTTYPDATFDAVVLHLILAVLPDPAAGLREAARVVRPGGRLVVLDKFVPGDGQPGWLRRLLERPAELAATSLSLRLSELVAGTCLYIEREEPAMLRGQFRLALLRRPDVSPHHCGRRQATVEPAVGRDVGSARGRRASTRDALAPPEAR